MAPRNMLPPEIQLYILECLMEPHKDADGTRARLSVYACVCKRWQWIVERKTFRHLRLHPSDIRDFADLAAPNRRAYIKHILLEIPIGDTIDGFPNNATLDEENNVIFTQAVRHLWEVLSAWRNHRLTTASGSGEDRRLETKPFRLLKVDKDGDGHKEKTRE
ncbi:hypothetical protein AK830_g7992 [Neonectria ditissima]|uniref:Uncharacterized protein n=1 Tax=Neonectria ditissima TaxID=78410 RepID=A0A0P7BDS1_9HYPO|nr:hypothetical protein AK830_g7992 [Neonectria ditissima]